MKNYYLKIRDKYINQILSKQKTRVNLLVSKLARKARKCLQRNGLLFLTTSYGIY